MQEHITRLHKRLYASFYKCLYMEIEWVFKDGKYIDKIYMDILDGKPLPPG